MAKAKPNLQHSITESSTTGERLRYARELRGLTQFEVAKALCLNTRIIEALESDNFAELSSPVFIKGYIRNYANLLRVSLFDADHPLEMANIPVSKPELKFSPVEESSFLERIFYFSGRVLLKLLNYLVILVLALLVFIWWHDRHHAVETQNSVISMSIQKVPFSRLEDLERKNAVLLPTPFDANAVTNLNQVLPWWQFVNAQGNQQ